VIGEDELVAGPQADGPLALDDHRRRPGAAAKGPAGALEGRGHRGHQPPRVDRVVARDVEGETDRRGERGLDATGAARQQALDVEAELAPEGEQAVERLGLVAIAGDDERARRPVARVDAALGQLGAEAGEGARRAKAELEQRRVAEVGLGRGREHAGGDLPRAGLAGVEHDRTQAALGGAPRAGEADRPAARYGEVIRARGHCWTFPPYAGTTRIRFDGRRPDAALSARSRAPVSDLQW
jgi:hypothetical protein